MSDLQSAGSLQTCIKTPNRLKDKPERKVSSSKNRSVNLVDLNKTGWVFIILLWVKGEMGEKWLEFGVGSVFRPDCVRFGFG